MNTRIRIKMNVPSLWNVPLPTLLLGQMSFSLKEFFFLSLSLSQKGPKRGVYFPKGLFFLSM